jgi:hypothetical protein
MAARGIDYVVFDVDAGGKPLEKTNLFQDAYDSARDRASLDMGISAHGHDSGRLENTSVSSGRGAKEELTVRRRCGGQWRTMLR